MSWLIGALEVYVRELNDAPDEWIGEQREILDTLQPFLDAIVQLEELRDRAEQEVEMLLTQHPELSEPSPFSDDELIDALRSAIEEWDAYLGVLKPGRTDGAVSAKDVVEVLHPGTPAYQQNRATSTTLRVGRALGRLADDGRVIRLRPKWGRGGNKWTLPGVSLGDYPLRGWRVDDA